LYWYVCVNVKTHFNHKVKVTSSAHLIVLIKYHYYLYDIYENLFNTKVIMKIEFLYKVIFLHTFCWYVSISEPTFTAK